VLNPGLVNGGYPKFEDFRALFYPQNPMSNFRRLQDAVAGTQPERLALVFVNDLYGSAKAMDHLEPNFVIVNIIRHLSAHGEPYVGGDQLASQPPGNKVPIHHSSTSDGPRIRSWNVAIRNDIAFEPNLHTVPRKDRCNWRISRNDHLKPITEFRCVPSNGGVKVSTKNSGRTRVHSVT
jgi:hypothetical protein